MADSPLPTHKVTHVRGWSVDMHIHPSVLENLHSRHDYELRNRSRTAVCAAFRDMCRRERIEGFNASWVDWDHIASIRPLSQHEVAYHASQRRPMSPDGYDCDECPMCENGDHQFCRSGNCPQVAP